MDVAGSLLPFRATPVPGCKFTMEDLLDTRNVPALAPLSFCPSCEDFGVSCPVGNHRRSRTPVVTAAPGELIGVYCEFFTRYKYTPKYIVVVVELNFVDTYVWFSCMFYLFK
jgi:hypothetical protein